MTRTLERLLRPRTIAVFGGKEARRVVEQSDKMGFSGEIWPVHPSRDEVAGHTCYRSVADLPEAPDAAFVGVNRTLTVDIVRQLADRGAGGAVCYASGFREAAAIGDGAALQDALVAAAGDMPIVGPNCYGVINAMDAALLWPDQHGLVREQGGVAILTQSSNIAINMSMQMRGLPIAYLMTAGNQAQTGISAMAAGVIEDSRVTAIGLHIEGFDNVAELEALARRARELGKPIVALKVGRSEAARTATVSHTASLAGDDAVSSALLRRLGIGRARSIPEFIETLKLLHVHGALPSRYIASMSCSGGEASMMADAAEGRRVAFRTLGEEQAAPLRAVLGDMVTVANPLDYHTFIWADRRRMAQTFTAMMRAKHALTMLVLDFPRSDRCDPADWEITIGALDDAIAATGERAAIVSTYVDTLPEADAKRLIGRGIVPLCGFDDAIAAVEIAADIGESWRNPLPAPLLSRSVAGDRPARILDENASKRALSRYGLGVPPGAVVGDLAEATCAAVEIGYPVVLKALGIAHKTEAGAVRLDIQDGVGLARALEEVAPLATRFLVERMSEKPVAELIVGMTHDEVAGPVMTVGAGGVLVELLRDCAILTLPARRNDIAAALRSLTIWNLLDGYRGGARADTEAAIDAIAAIGRFCEANAAVIEELDVNPLFVFAEGRGAVAVDALITTRGDLT